MILTYLLLLTALIAHLFMDLHKQGLHRPIKHWISAMLVVAVSCVAGLGNQLLFPDIAFWQFAIYSMSIHLALFDPIWNIIHVEDWWYSGDPNNPNRAWTDKCWQYVPPMGQVLFRIWFILFGSGWYYHLSLILG